KNAGVSGPADCGTVPLGKPRTDLIDGDDSPRRHSSHHGVHLRRRWNDYRAASPALAHFAGDLHDARKISGISQFLTPGFSFSHVCSSLLPVPKAQLTMRVP